MVSIISDKTVCDLCAVRMNLQVARQNLAMTAPNCVVLLYTGSIFYYTIR